MKFKPCVRRLSNRTCSELYQLFPTGMLVSVTPVNCGNGSSSCWRVVVAPLMLVEGSSPENGLGTLLVRLGDALPPYSSNCAVETALRFCETSMELLRLPT